MHPPMKIPFWELLVYPHPLLNPLLSLMPPIIPTSKPGTERDIVQPISSEEARAAYLEERMKNMGGM